VNCFRFRFRFCVLWFYKGQFICVRVSFLCLVYFLFVVVWLSVPMQSIALVNDLLCVESDVKAFTLTHLLAYVNSSTKHSTINIDINIDIQCLIYFNINSNICNTNIV